MMTRNELTEAQILSSIAQIAAELDAFPYVARTWNDLSHEVGLHGNAGGGHYQVVEGCAGAAVFHDIINEGGSGTRSFVSCIADRFILGLPFVTAAERKTADAIREVAILRLTEPFNCAAFELPPGSGEWYRPSEQRMPVAKAVVVIETGIDKLSARVVRDLKSHARKPEGEQAIRWIAAHARQLWREALDQTGEREAPVDAVPF